MNPIDVHLFEKAQNPYGAIKNVIAVMSGKGGVGKSSITALLASALNRRGFKVAVLDADITGPSIPKIFGIKEKAAVTGEAFVPPETALGIKIMSINLLLENEEEPVIWRGPLITGTIKQFFEQVKWGDLDFLVVDQPPGTGDVPLTVMQSLPLTGLIIVSSPQQLVTLIVKKAIKMAGKMNIPILGLIENFSYFECPDCKRKTEIFGKSRAEDVASETGISLLGRLPILPELAQMSDEGKIEAFESIVPGFFDEVVDNMLAKAELRS
ncbi:MAG: Mrp/NBP35 family ATP-binding protein [Bacteroidota bacterium]